MPWRVNFSEQSAKLALDAGEEQEDLFSVFPTKGIVTCSRDRPRELLASLVWFPTSQLKLLQDVHPDFSAIPTCPRNLTPGNPSQVCLLPPTLTKDILHFDEDTDACVKHKQASHHSVLEEYEMKVSGLKRVDPLGRTLRDRLTLGMWSF